MNLEHSMGAMQQQLKSIAEQLQNYNRNKSILGEGLTASIERGSSSRITALHPPSEENPTQYNAIHRMEFPLFNREEARIWVRRCNRYFQMIPIPEEQKVPLASVYMQGRAELWYQGHVEKRGVPTWSELTIIVLERFEDLDHERVVSEFNMLHQDTTVNAYLEKFEVLEAHMLIFNKNLDEAFFMMKFISGLKEEIKGYVATMKPTTLDQSIVLARKQESMVNAILRKTNQHQKTNQGKPIFKPPNKGPPYKPSFKPSFRYREENSQPKRFLTKAEVRARKEKNLCYKCDEPYTPGHRCKYRQVHMLMTEEEAKAYEEGEEQIEDSPEDEDATVSFHAMGGITVLGCTLEQTTPMAVRIADGGRVMSKYFCPTFCWEIQGHHFSHPVRVLKLGGYNCVLGCDWLSINNPIELDFHQLQEPRTLPPERTIEHHIELVPDAIPRKQHPYRYAYGQKTEIEKIVREMLESGIIRISQSSFASPVLLVKKKDGGWRLCVDYRYLNKLTVKHNFPIPVIDELLDELHGAKYFPR
ncbi:UNVERIFIED_CONTAM: Transposon Ty3-G Gag-Pol polyprotein [Sesamum calycinum]|uniref:Transposon Ty3-G Gag-Pol polyprotein n=1 Tax=Sesamum calycinum TaxID=2727403 RepID=A0AAW2M272_9LAMI